MWPWAASYASAFGFGRLYLGRKGLLRNPSVERGKGNRPDGWVSSSSRSLGSVSEWDDRVAHTGDRSLRIDALPQGVKGSASWVSAKIALKPDRLTTISAWIRANADRG